MPIPDYETLMLPVLRIAGDGKEHRIGDVIEQLADEFRLTADERQQLLPSGKQATFSNRVHWARTYLVQAGLLEPTRRAHFRITERGKQALSQAPARIDNEYLLQFPEFIKFRERNHVTGTPQQAVKATAEITRPNRDAGRTHSEYGDPNRGRSPKGTSQSNSFCAACLF